MRALERASGDVVCDEARWVREKGERHPGSWSWRLARKGGAVNMWMVAGMVGSALASGVTMAAADGGPQVTASGLTIAVDLADYVHVAPKALAEAEARVTASYRAVGIDVVWTSSQSDVDGTSALTTSGVIRVRVVLVPHARAEAKCREERLSNDVIGVAISGASDARGRIAYIFYHRIERLALAQGAPVARGLGHVMAHEIGHLLLGVNSHSSDGLMQPDWLPRDTHLQTLTNRQVRVVTRRFAAVN